ncbi:MAG: DUF4982 domain-containing protein [Lachnospiraceae bacterium]|nr:DUF4982 domain-containing protein [Lachnospiraceae bacterium]
MELILNKAWFTLDKTEDAWSIRTEDLSDYEGSHFRQVFLPHDWALEYPFSKEYSSGTGYVRGGTGYYRIPADIPEDLKDSDITLIFEGVYKRCRVWMNQYYLGDHANGYTSFSFDVSHAILFGKPNYITVEVNHEDISDSRWYTGSGIERPVKLLIQPKVHEKFSERAFSAVPVYDGPGRGSDSEKKDSGASGSSDSVNIRINHVLVNNTSYEETVNVRDFLDGKLISERTLKLSAGEETFLDTGIEKNNKDRALRLWSPETPVLYEWKSVVTTDTGLKDELTEKVGITETHFDPDKGFFCNGIPMKLKGVCLHEDCGSFGNAVPKNVWESRLKLLKEMGVNTIRMSHNPHSNCLYELCDEMGFFVIDEIFDEWEGPKNKWWQGHNVYPPRHQGYYLDYPLWHEKDIESFVKSRRSHPSVILWSIGNEIDYPNDPYCHRSFSQMTGNNDAGKPAAERMYDEKKPDAVRLKTLIKELSGLVRKYDCIRPVTLAFAFPELSSKIGLFEDLDVIGYNYKEQYYEQDHKLFPDKPIFGSENGHEYSQWRYVLDNEFISGQCLWTGIDYLGETKLWPERGSHAGHMTTAGIPKAEYYFRKSLFSDEPFVKLAAMKASENKTGYGFSFSWNHKDGELIDVEAYSNLPEVELFLNEKSLGIRKRDERGRFSWQVPFEAGTLKAVAADGPSGKEYSDSLITHGDETVIRTQLIDRGLKADENSVYQILVTLADGNGNPVCDRDIELCAQIEGEAVFLHMDSGDLSDTTPYTEKIRRTYEGNLMLYVRSTGVTGDISAELKPADCSTGGDPAGGKVSGCKLCFSSDGV